MPKGKPAARPVREEVAELRSAIEQLSMEIQVLRQVLDELRDDYGWALQNSKIRSLPPPFVLTSMPADPLSRDWQLNRLSAADLPPEPPTSPPSRTSLFD